MPEFSVDARILAVRLGVGDLYPWQPTDTVDAPERCWGYAACCNCCDCMERERLIEEGPPLPPSPQPWQALEDQAA